MQVSTYWGHTYLPGRLRAGGVVFDLGVNSGGFSRLVASRCRRVIGFEPDPSWAGRLELPANVTLIHKAIAAKPGRLPLHLNPVTCSSLHYGDSNAATAEVEAITLAEALALEPAGRIELIKMDIEGEEIAVLRDAPEELFDRVAQMTVEFHDFIDPASVPAIREVIARMHRLGFHIIKFSWRSYGDVLFLNKKLEPLSLWQRCSLRLIHKYGRGALRVLRRQWRTAPANG
jgi:FkbM family methyltransferase